MRRTRISCAAMLAIAAFLASPLAAAPPARSSPEVVATVCSACHGTGAKGAPAVGDRGVSVLAAAPHAAIPGARVETSVEQPGAAGETRALEPMTIGGTPSYGNYFRLQGGKPGAFVVSIRKPGAAQATEARFRVRPD